jgi:endonuclease YncB( thermonuclease family)
VSMPEQLWVYRARLVRVVDGDTLDATIDAGFHAYRTERLRLLGVDTPEVFGPKAEPAGAEATIYAKAWFADAGPGDWPLIVRTEKSDVFGRFLAVVWRASDGACLNDDLLASGHAEVYGKGVPEE